LTVIRDRGGSHSTMNFFGAWLHTTYYANFGAKVTQILKLFSLLRVSRGAIPPEMFLSGRNSPPSDRQNGRFVTKFPRNMPPSPSVLPSPSRPPKPPSGVKRLIWLDPGSRNRLDFSKKHGSRPARRFFMRRLIPVYREGVIDCGFIGDLVCSSLHKRP